MGAFEPQISFVTTADDRVLEVAVAGPVDGTPLFFHHGTPGAAALFEPNVEMGAERGLRHIAYSRPGYGGSTRMEGRTVADCAADVAAIADAMQLERFHTLGGSGGGPHSLACARLLGNRVISAATIASCAPMDAESLDWTAGMGKENLAEFAAVRAGDIALKEYLEGEVQAMAGTTGEQVVAALGDLISDVDRRALSGDFGDHVARQLARALSSGVSGWLDDDKAFFSDWGSISRRESSRSRSGTARRTASCRSRTANGSRPTSPERGCTFDRTTGTCRSRSTPTAGSSMIY